MKKFSISILVLLVAISLVGVPNASAQTGSSLDAFINAFNVYSIDGMEKAIAKGFTWRWTSGGRADDDEVLQTRSDFEEMLRTLEPGHAKIVLSDIVTDGSNSTFKFTLRFDMLEKLDLGPAIGTGEAEDDDGKLKALTLHFDPEFIAKAEAAFDGQGQDLPRTGAESRDLGWYGLAALGAALIFGGIGLRRKVRLDR